MFLNKAADDLWTPLGITSLFSVTLKGSATCETSDACGLGWRFNCAVVANVVSAEQQLAAISRDGTFIPSSTLSLYFDPHRVVTADYGRITIKVVATVTSDDGEAPAVVVPTGTSADFTKEMMLPYLDPLLPEGLLIAQYVLSSTATLELAITVSLPDFPTPLPRSVDRQLAGALHRALRGEAMADLKIYAYNRRVASICDVVTDLKPVFVNSSLLAGHSDKLDQLLFASNCGPVEEEASSNEYIDDSDLEDAENEEHHSPSPSLGDDFEDIQAAVPLGSRTAPTDVYRVAIVHGVAFKTLEALVFYLYTSKICFDKESVDGTPTCSPKSMYHLAHKFGLRQLEEKAFAAIKENLNPGTVVGETFSILSSRYPEVQDACIRVLLDRIKDSDLDSDSDDTKTVAEALKLRATLDATMRKVAGGELPHAGNVLCKLFAKTLGYSSCDSESADADIAPSESAYLDDEQEDVGHGADSEQPVVSEEEEEKDWGVPVKKKTNTNGKVKGSKYPKGKSKKHGKYADSD
ncbi:F-box domain-containing protein [Mycena chlorophos]|uniref:F-box domain-containing protein n=1 Tax=Mycena chlorophos TaxID=658473 RepID=A0A8H6VU03_MYCCL|nr:F-box domain-containing protein [Mycena chlorophos]